MAARRMTLCASDGSIVWQGEEGAMPPWLAGIDLTDAIIVLEDPPETDR